MDPYNFALANFSTPRPYASNNTASIPLRPNAPTPLRNAPVITNPAVFRTPALAASYRTAVLQSKFVTNNADVAQLQQLLAALPTGN